jgi:hypothetical protein
MPNPFDTSFIPQQPLLKVEGTSQRKEPLNIALIVAIIIFIATAITGGGLYYWKTQVMKKVEAKGIELKEAEKYFRAQDIDMFKHLQVSLDTAKRLVDEHTIFSVVFDLIEERAAQNIALTGLGYSQEVDGTVVTLSGQSPSYAALYFQIDTWRKVQPMVKSVTLSTFTLQDTSGVVDFTVKVVIDPMYLRSTSVLQAQTKEQFNAPASEFTAPVVPGLGTNTPPRI